MDIIGVLFSFFYRDDSEAHERGRGEAWDSTGENKDACVKGGLRPCFEEESSVESTQAVFHPVFWRGWRKNTDSRPGGLCLKRTKVDQVAKLKAYSSLALLMASWFRILAPLSLALVLHVVSKTGCIVLNCVHTVHQRKGMSRMHYCRVAKVWSVEPSGLCFMVYFSIIVYKFAYSHSHLCVFWLA